MFISCISYSLLYQSETGELARSCTRNQCFKRTFSGRKTNILIKSPHLFVFKRSQIEYLWMVLMAEHLRAQWDILLLFIDILTKYFIVLSNLSRQHHSAGTQFGFFGQKKCGLFLKRFVFPPECPLETVSMISKIRLLAILCFQVWLWLRKLKKIIIKSRTLRKI